MKLADFIPDYMKYHVMRNNKHSSQIAKRQILNKSILPCLGHVELADIDSMSCDDLIVFCEDLGLQKTTINDHISVLSTIMRVAMRRKMIRAMPTLERVKGAHKEKKAKARRVKFLEPDQVGKLLQACDDPTIRAMIKFAVTTGLRIGELRNLKWAHLDEAKGEIEVVEAYSGRNTISGTVKGHDSRFIPFGQKAKDAIVSLRKFSPFVFGAPIGSDGIPLALSYKACHERGIVRAAKIAGIWFEDFGFHTLRHTYASLLIRQGRDILEVRDLLGHVDISITMRYAHLRPNVLKDAATSLDSLFD